MNKYQVQPQGAAVVKDDLVPLVPIEEVETERTSSALDFDVKALWAAVYRNRYFVIGIITICILAGLVIAMLTTPLYRATATVQIDQEASKVLETQDTQPGVSVQDSERFLQTQLDVIRSRALATKVAEALRLTRDDRFLTAMGVEPPAPGNDAQRRAQLQDRVVSVLQDNVTVELPRSSRVATIGFTSPDPEYAARVANGYVEAYITSNLQRRFDASAYARRFLEQRLAETKARLEASERQAIAYARNAQLIDTGGAAATPGAAPSQSSLVSTNLVSLNDAYSTARAQRLAAEQRWRVAQATPVMNLPEVMSNQTINGLQASRAEALATYTQNRARYGAEHPLILQGQARVSEIDRQIARIAGQIRSSIRDQYQTALGQEQALQRDVASLQQATLNERDRSVNYNILRREADTNRALYDALLQRYREVSAAAGITTNNIARLDVAQRPGSPISPNAIMNMLMGAIGGLALALLFVFIRETIDDILRTPEDIERHIGLPLLGSVPLTEAGIPLEEALSDQKSSVSEAYFSIRTSLELSSAGGLPPTIYFTSSVPGEGKSTSAFATARGFAQIGKRTILIDADLRKPSVHRLLAVANRIGLSNVLSGQKPLSDVVQHSDVPNLDFMTCGPVPPNPAELLAGNTMNEVLAELSANYDLVVIDGPPVLGLADAPAVSSAASATVLVIQANSARRGRVKAATRRLVAARGRLIGAILTKFDPKRAAYASDYSYDYYYYGNDKDKDAGPGSGGDKAPAA